MDPGSRLEAGCRAEVDGGVLADILLDITGCTYYSATLEAVAGCVCPVLATLTVAEAGRVLPRTQFSTGEPCAMCQGPKGSRSSNARCLMETWREIGFWGGTVQIK